MALVNFDFQSDCLKGDTEISVILPDKPWGKNPTEFYRSGKKYPVLWLLHGTFGDHSDWVRKSNIELYACEKDVIVVMPSGLNANYANWPNFSLGYNMYDFLFDELMPLIYGWFPASDKREDNFVAGLSMGGRGTCVYAFSRPEKFGGAAILSACPRNVKTMAEDDPRMWERTLGSIENQGGLENYLNSYENSWDILDKLVEEKADLPKLYFACGEDDMLYKPYMIFKKHAEEIGLDAKFEEIPGYRHEWRFWDLTIEKAMNYFGLTKEDGGNPF